MNVIKLQELASNRDLLKCCEMFYRNFCLKSFLSENTLFAVETLGKDHLVRRERQNNVLRV